jgi:hypothetical protein
MTREAWDERDRAQCVIGAAGWAHELSPWHYLDDSD